MLDFIEILYTCSFGEYLGIIFSLFKNFDFWAWDVVPVPSPKMTENFGAAWRSQKLLDFVEIWYTCSLGEYLGVFFSFFEDFYV